jgi:CheY-like chemotaxis protein
VPTILVVEDHPLHQVHLRQLLEGEGYRVHMSADGQDAYDLLAGDFTPDLLLTDVSLPGMSGLELTRGVRRLAHLRTLPIVVRSAMDTDYGRGEACAAGADAFVSKREAAGDLLRTLRGLLSADPVELP